VFPITFQKARAERFLRCIEKGEPIGKVQTVDEMLSLAGAYFFALLSHGPLLRRTAAELAGERLPKDQPREHSEADEEMVFSDLHAAIEFVGHLTMLVHDKQYDARFEPVIRCLVNQDKQIRPIDGFKSIS